MQIGHVKKWSEFQHYKDRSPPWIKLQKRLLDDYDFACLQLASKALAPLLWLLASESTDGSVRIDPEWLAFRLRWPLKDASDGISGLIQKGFVVPASASLATCYQPAIPETEVEVEVEAELSTSNEVDVGICDPDFPLDETDDSTRAKDEAQPAGGQAPADRNPCPLKRIVELYHESLPELPRVEKLTKVRAGYIQQRWREDLPSVDSWGAYFADVRNSKFLMGKTQGRDGKPPFRADLEWLTRPGNFAKVAEGKYHS